MKRSFGIVLALSMWQKGRNVLENFSNIQSPESLLHSCFDRVNLTGLFLVKTSLT